MTDPSSRGRASDVFERAARSTRSHPWFAAVLVVAGIAALVVSWLIGLPVIVTLGLLGMVGVGAHVLWRLWVRRRPERASMTSSAAGRVGVVAVALSGVLTFAVIQLVPYGRAHSNPPVTGEPQWANARTRELMVTACFSCHSNEVEYPAYASVAPISWLVQRHVDEGRESVNYSEFATHPGHAKNSVEIIQEGEMPPAYFTRFGLHPGANLTAAETAELIDGLRQTPGLAER